MAYVYKKAQLKIHLKPEVKEAFKTAIQKNGDTMQKVLEKVVLEYIERSKL